MNNSLPSQSSIIQMASNSTQAGTGVNVAESPFLQTPNQSENARKNSQPKKMMPSIKPLYAGLAALIFVLLLAGGGVGLFLSSQPQDTRQQASSPVGTANLKVIPGSTTLSPGSIQEPQVEVALSSSPQTITSLVLLVKLSGIIPTDFEFIPKQISGMNQALIDIGEGENQQIQLTITFSSTSPTGATLTGETIPLGSFHFTTPTSGEMTIAFDSTDSHMITTTGGDILRPLPPITYSITPGLFDAPPTGEFTATPTLALLADAPPVGGSFSLVPTASPTATIAIITQASDSARTSSLPATTQDQPVSGSAQITLFLFLLGGFSIVLGTVTLAKVTRY